MLVKGISLTFDSALGGFRDDELREFLKDKELVSMQEPEMPVAPGLGEQR